VSSGSRRRTVTGHQQQVQQELLEGFVCPICYLTISGTEAQISRHVDRCLSSVSLCVFVSVFVCVCVCVSVCLCVCVFVLTSHLLVYRIRCRIRRHTHAHNHL